MGRDERANAARRAEDAENMRRARLQALGEAATYLSRSFLSLGPCFAVTVAFTGPGQKDGNAETYSFTSWFDKGMGSGHLAELSDRLNEQHVKIQSEIDQEEHERRQEAANDEGVRPSEGNEDSPEGTPGGDPQKHEEG